MIKLTVPRLQNISQVILKHNLSVSQLQKAIIELSHTLTFRLLDYFLSEFETKTAQGSWSLQCSCCFFFLGFFIGVSTVCFFALNVEQKHFLKGLLVILLLKYLLKSSTELHLLFLFSNGRIQISLVIFRLLHDLKLIIR